MANIFNCKLENSVLRTSSCGYSLQSVKTIYLANKADVTAIKKQAPADAGGACGQEVATITLGEMAKWAKIDPSTNSASFTDTLQVIDNGGKYRQHTLSFSIAGAYDPYMACVLDNLSLGEFIAVAETSNGNFILLGTEAVGLTATNVSNTGSASATEFSGITVEMQADVTESAAPLSTEAIAAIKAAVADPIGAKA